MNEDLTLPPPGSPQDRRLTFRLLSYWQRMRGERAFPSLADMQITDILELWHHTFTIQMDDGTGTARFQYFGPCLNDLFGENVTGEPVDQMLEQSAKLENTLGCYREAAARKTPVSDSSQFYLEGQEVRYRTLIVPLSTDGVHVDYLMGTTNYKVF